MIRLRVLDILQEQGHPKYWLFNQMDLSYKNSDRMVNNETSAIRYENIEKLCRYLNCEPTELFEILPDKTNVESNDTLG